MSIVQVGPGASGTGEWFKEDEEDKEDTVRVVWG